MEPGPTPERRGGMTHPRALLLFLVALSLATGTAACSAVSGQLVGPAWTLVAVGGKPPVAAGSITFSADGRVSFQTGCNSGGGEYTVDAASVVFGVMAMTEMACDGPRGDQEAAFVAVLSSKPTFIIAGRRLTLGSGASSLTFSAGDA